MTKVNTDGTVDEISALRSCLNNLIGVLTLPPKWGGSGPNEIINILLDAILRTLHLDFAYASLKSTNPQIETMRLPSSGYSAVDEELLRQTVALWLTHDLASRTSAIWWPGPDKKLSIVSLRLGITEHIGDLVAGSSRSDFASKTERLVLNVAANQAVIALQGAGLRTAKDLGLRADGQKSQAEIQRRYDLLTSREREVLPYVVAGRLSKQTAAELGTSEITIRVHRGQIMRKMHAQSLADLIKMATILGIL